MILYAIPVLAITVSLLIRAELKQSRIQIYVFKPLSTLLVIAVAVFSFFQPESNITFSTFILIGLIFSFVGDVALMFQQNRQAFLLGLVAFLLGHVAYAIGFGLFTTVTALDLLTASVLFAAGLGFYRLLKPNLGSMKFPVILYMVVISIMVSRAFAALVSPVFSATQAWMIAAGALLFYLSDVLLAANKFWNPWRYSRFSLLLYYGGQMLIALSVNYF